MDSENIGEEKYNDYRVWGKLKVENVKKKKSSGLKSYGWSNNLYKKE